jgi:hypothetical protein
MPSSVSSPADVINVALVRLGYKDRIGNLYEGSMPSKAALDIYAQTRDELLRQFDWEFAEGNVSLTLLKQAPSGGYIPPVTWTTAYPPVPWLYEYELPTDYIKIRAIKPTPLFLFNADPQPYRFSLANDNSYTPAKRVLLCNVADALLVYTRQVTDPATWEADFVEAFSSALARRLAPILANADMLRIEAADEAQSTAIAEGQIG